MKNLHVTALGILAAVFATSAMAAETINGAGATFPSPIYQQWFGEYKKAHPEVSINYQSLGSGAGIRQLTEGTVDFGASDMPMMDEQLKALRVKALHFSTVLGADVLTYNLPGVNTTLKFSSEGLVLLALALLANTAARMVISRGVSLPK